VRPCLTIALLLLASMGAQGGSTNQPSGDAVTPRLLAALMEQPAGILSSSQLTVPPAGKLLLSQLVAPPSPVCPAGLPAAGSALPGVVVRRAGLIPGGNLAIAPCVTRGP